MIKRIWIIIKLPFFLACALPMGICACFEWVITGDTIRALEGMNKLQEFFYV